MGGVDTLGTVRREDTLEAYEEVRLEPLLTIRQVGTILAISRESVYRLIRAGELGAIRVGSHRRFDPADVRTYLAEHREPTPGMRERN
jgi:excisionase family DNA binding protein